MFSMGQVKQRIHNINMKIGRLRWEFANEPVEANGDNGYKQEQRIIALFEELEVELEQLEENI